MPANGLRVNHYDFVALEKNSSTIRSSGRNPNYYTPVGYRFSFAHLHLSTVLVGTVYKLVGLCARYSFECSPLGPNYPLLELDLQQLLVSTWIISGRHREPELRLLDNLFIVGAARTMKFP